ncbi:MAG: exodeoxyribonuclease VII small subunit [Azoarcus sp.]|jgi:exodeoxyribonuclease VII small subunit|nr:exodeoxyribonuclease VII small subunit [Azoarcus sp.]
MTEPVPAAHTFETAMTELEAIVRQMETGGLPLEQALDHYRRGTALLRQCQDKLNAAERQVEILEGDSLVPLEADSIDPDSVTRI